MIYPKKITTTNYVRLITFLISMMVGFYGLAQPCSCTQCPVRTVDLVPGTIPISVEGLTNDDLSDPAQGICAVRLEFVHGDIGDMTIELVSPAGTSVLLVGPFSLCGFTGGNTWNVTFLPCGDPVSPDPGFTDRWDNCDFENTFDVDYSGSYYPAVGCLENFNTGPANGTWQLNFLDNLPGSFGDIQDLEITFCDLTGALKCETAICNATQASLPDDIFDCTGENITIREGNNPLLFTHTWSTMDGDIISGQGSNEITVGDSGTYTVVIEGPDPVSGLLCFDTASIEVSLSMFEVPELVFDPVYEFECGQTSLTIDPLVINPLALDSVLWTTTNGTIIGSDNNTSVVVGDIGTYNVTVMNPDSCENSYVITVVGDIAEPIFTIDSFEQITCRNPIATLNLSDVAIDDTVRWTGPGIVPGEDSQMLTVSEMGIYTATVTGENGCITAHSVLVTVDTVSPEISISQTGPVPCEMFEAQLIATADVPLEDVLWTGPGITALTESLVNPMISTPGQYSLTVTDTANGCSTTITENTLDFGIPLSGFLLETREPSCERPQQGVISITDVIGGTEPIRVFINDQQVASTSQTDLGSGEYAVLVTDDNGCELRDTVNFADIQDLTLDIGPDLEIELGDNVDLDPAINKDPSALVEILWTGAAIDCETCLQQMLSPQRSGTYTIRLLDDIGCLREDEVYINVTRGNTIYVPNVFSPNSDNINDTWEPLLTDKIEMLNDVSVYDRLGNQVYQAQNISPGVTVQGWDGIFKGELLTPAVFSYVIRYTLISGEVLIQSGDVTLVR